MAALEIHAASKANMLTAAREYTRPSRITGEEYFRFFINQSSINVLVAANHCAVRAKGALRELQWFCAAIVLLKLLEVQTVCLCRQSRTMQTFRYVARFRQLSSKKAQHTTLFSHAIRSHRSGNMDQASLLQRLSRSRLRRPERRSRFELHQSLNTDIGPGFIILRSVEPACFFRLYFDRCI
jgi:hypothetical protein